MARRHSRHTSAKGGGDDASVLVRGRGGDWASSMARFGMFLYHVMHYKANGSVERELFI